MLRYIKIAIIAFIFSGLVPGFAQDHIDELYFRTIDMTSGLSDNSVNVVIQDRSGLVWIGTKDGLNIYDGISVNVIRSNSGNPSNDYINSLFEDSDGTIWIGTEHGVCTYDAALGCVLPFDVQSSNTGEPITRAVKHICEDSKTGNVLFSVNDQGFFSYDKASGELAEHALKCGSDLLAGQFQTFWLEDKGTHCRTWFAHYDDDLYFTDSLAEEKASRFVDGDGNAPFRGHLITCIGGGLHNTMLVGTNMGLYEVNLTTGIVVCLQSCFVNDFNVLSGGSICICTEDGLLILDSAEGSTQIVHSKHIRDKYSLSDNTISTICRDMEGGLWLGTYSGGVSYYHEHNSLLKKVYPNENAPSMGNRVRRFCFGDDGIVWVGTEDRGLFRYDSKSGSIEPFTHPDLYHNIHGLCRIGDDLWIGTFSKGLSRLDLKTGKFFHYDEGTGRGRLPASQVYSICHTSLGDILLGTNIGIFRYVPSTDSFEYLPELRDEFIYDILEDSSGNIWLASLSHGAFLYDVKQGQLTNFMPREDDPHSLPFHKVICLFEDHNHLIWMGTHGGGLCSYDIEKGCFDRYDTSDGLPSNVIRQILEDKDGMLWVTTNQGLVRMNSETKEMQVLNTRNGMLSNQFNSQSGAVDQDGNLYLGTNGGFVVFNPSDYNKSTVRPQLLLASFRTYDKSYIVEDDGGQGFSLVVPDKIKLRHNRRSFSVKAAVLSYMYPEMNQVLYRMDGLDEGWQTLSGSDVIRYSQIPYGTYDLHVVGQCFDGQKTDERVIRIKNCRPLLLSDVAMLIYAILLGLIGYYFYARERERSRQRHAAAIENIKRDKERELYEAKIDFFTNIAHEIRTPLTLIKSPLDHVLRSSGLTPEVKQDLNIMDSNTQRLLDLVSQLLDFRKTESMVYPIKLSECDLSELLRGMQSRFASYAESSNVRFGFKMPESLHAAVDKEGFTKIVSNMLTNAIKYSSSYVDVDLSVSDSADEVLLTVTNDGDVVPADMRETIFKSFTRYDTGGVRQGSGIGLTLARSLAELMGGRLAMDGDLSCNRFILALPLKHVTVPEAEPVEDSVWTADTGDAADAAESIANGNAYTVLVVEDSQEICDFISHKLSDQYKILTAHNGQEAMDILAQEIVHLIVSDVMMPVMDGLELCRRVKEDLDYCHIPVILLTAKVGTDAIIEGLNEGADDYIGKPFSMDVLKARIVNILKTREQLRSAYRNSPMTHTDTLAISKVEEDFLKRLQDLTMEHLGDAEFTVEQLADELAMSRTSLNRKISSLLGVSPNEFLRIERLKKAAELIARDGYKINEVCYMVGFNTPSYFAKCFKAQFGMLPKDFARKE